MEKVSFSAVTNRCGSGNWEYNAGIDNGLWVVSVSNLDSNLKGHLSDAVEGRVESPFG
jgi:hypothetical protein